MFKDRGPWWCEKSTFPLFEEYEQIRLSWRLLISDALKNIKTAHCPTLFGVLPRPLLKYIPRRKAALPTQKNSNLSAARVHSMIHTLF